MNKKILILACLTCLLKLNGSRPAEFAREITNDYIRLEKSLRLPGEPVPPRRVTGPQGTQDQINKARSRLYNLFYKALISSGQSGLKYRNEILAAIKELSSYNPSDWPQPEDYENVLSATLGELERRRPDELMGSQFFYLPNARTEIAIPKPMTISAPTPTAPGGPIVSRELHVTPPPHLAAAARHLAHLVAPSPAAAAIPTALAHPIAPRPAAPPTAATRREGGAASGYRAPAAVAPRVTALIGERPTPVPAALQEAIIDYVRTAAPGITRIRIIAD